MITLTKSLLIAKGGERDCYIHPEDNSKVIKIVHKTEEHNNQNELEYSYMTYIKKRKGLDLSQITDCYGYVSTNLGKGLIFDRVLDFDGTPSKSFRYYLANKIIPLAEQELLITELKNYLEENLILFVDTSLTNIFCPKVSDSSYKLIIVDGLGAKRTGIKFTLYKISKAYTKYKIKRQWDKFMKMYEKDVKRAKLGKRPFTRL
ncbi:YrbL family protein [Halarcobacter bivalviorum]|uniref:YrbL family protein n=1 Tax=Halarcobacter bivalviorum TaxID=663364 RepID=A0AAX2ACZ8_9BACT|nr:YrbL family protein [Halarcobacter bivalviorum]AXH11865.1 YrbL family protein [Halarcobacter bivalviorum]RXK10988.1 hypothetical protein CRV05_01060 [Halarcobacter bivalviorum]